MFLIIQQQGSDHADELAQGLERQLGSTIVWFQEFGVEQLGQLLNRKPMGMAIDCALLPEDDGVVTQALLGISDLVPTVYFNLSENIRRAASLHRPASAVFCLESEPEIVLEALQSVLARNESRATGNVKGIPVFERHYALDYLKEGAGISMLSIDATSLASIEARFGRKAFDDAVHYFHQLLAELWGSTGSFRARDLLCRHKDLNLVYLIVLEANRTLGRMPPPGSLEKIADRVQVQIDNRLWHGLGKRNAAHGLPSGMTIIPQICVGYASAAASLLEDDDRLIENVVTAAVRSTTLQQKRLHIRRKEYLQNLIAATDSLHPSFQAVFRLQGLTKQHCDEAESFKALGPLTPLLFGFESLIRAQQDVIADLLGSSQLFTLDPTLLRPDILFTLAKSVDADLELDLRAMRQALTYGQVLPGKLMINILPRNFYNLRKIRHSLPHDSRIVFEVSESEAIENFELVQEVRTELRNLNIGVATDDFGRDYGGLERIFKIRPDIIKLDRALVSNIHLDPPRLAFVSGLVQSVKIINAMTLAEGVELWEEAEVLQSIGVDLIQGYLLHRPERAESIKLSLVRGCRPLGESENTSPGGRVIPLKVG